MKFKELQNKTVAELHKILDETRSTLQDVRFKTASNQHKNVRDVRTLRKTIARVLMLIKKKQQEDSKPAEQK